MIGNQMFHCAAVLLGVRPAATQLSAPETALLESLAAQAPVIAEIGVFEGVTSRRMIERMPKDGTMYCIDPFFSGRLGVAYGYWITRAQTRRAGRKDVDVKIVRQLSYDFAAEHDGQFDLIFIDADHSYEAVKRDWKDWAQKVKVGGRIALHDSQPMAGRCPETCGPVRLVCDLGNSPPGFVLQESKDTITVFQRVS
jgi:hypothetical protein